MDLSKLLDWSYLLRPYTVEALSWPFRLALYGFCLLVIAAAIWSHRQLVKNPGFKKSFYKKTINFGWSVGVLGLFLIFFRETRALYLGSRLWLLLWLLGALTWLLYLIIYYFRVLPKLKKQREEHVEFNKWLPKTKK